MTCTPNTLFNPRREGEGHGARMIQLRAAAIATAVLVLLSLGNSHFAASGSVLSDFRIGILNTEHGLPQNTVKSILQSRDGYLWFGTRFGVVRFDGISPRVWDRSNTPQLEFENGTLMAEDSEGGIWFGDIPVLVRLKPDGYGDLEVDLQLRGIEAESIHARSAGGLWIGRDGGLFTWHNGSFDCVWPTESLVLAVIEGPDGTVWFGSDSGLYRLPPNAKSPEFILIDPDTVGTRNYVSCMALTPDGSAWAGVLGHIVRIRDGEVTRWPLPGSDGARARIHFIRPDRNGDIWVGGSNDRLYCWRAGEFVECDSDRAIGRHRPLTALEDREGNFWIGTEFDGIRKLERRRVKSFGLSDGLLNENVWSICESPIEKGTLWMSADDSISRYKDGRFESWPLPPAVKRTEFERNQARSILASRSGDVWVGTRLSGLLRFRDGEWTQYWFTGKQSLDQVGSLYEDSGSCLWIGTKAGLYCYSRGHFERLSFPESGYDSIPEVRGILEDKNGSFWFATYGHGLFRLRGGTLTRLTTADGLSDNFTWALVEDSQGKIWAGTENGLNLISGGNLFVFDTENGLFDNVINSILEDGENNLWLSSNRGISRVNRADLIDVAAGRRTRLSEYVSFGIADGMRSSETNGEQEPSACRASDGRLWFPTVNGPVVIDPVRTVLNTREPPVVIEQVLVDHQAIPLAGGIVLEPGRGRSIEITFTANSFVDPRKVRFRYRLEGVDQDWQYPSGRRQATYTNLRPGAYRFFVTASNNHGTWSQSGDSIAFSIKPHFYETRWFYTLSAALISSIALGAHRYRIRVLRRIQSLEKTQALELERSRISREMHDEIGSHLTQAALLGGLASRESKNEADRQSHLNRLNKTISQISRAMNEIVWATNPGHDNLSSLVDYMLKHAEHYLRPAHIACRWDVPEVVPETPVTSDERHHVMAILKEALNNILKHAATTEVWIRIRIRDEKIEFAVEDNGAGFDLRGVNPLQHGLDNMRHRASRLGGSLEIDSAPGSGTRIQFWIPRRQG